MAFPTPPVGSAHSRNAHATISLQEYTSPLIDVSAGIADMPLLYDAEYDLGIHSIELVYQVAATNTSGAIIIGTDADNDAVVESVACAVAGTATLHYVQTLSLASTLQSFIQKHGGSPILPKGTVLDTTVSAGSSNAGDFYIKIKYWKVMPGVA